MHPCFCIKLHVFVMQKDAPVNFVDHDCDADEVRKPTDFDSFVKLKRDRAKQSLTLPLKAASKKALIHVVSNGVHEVILKRPKRCRHSDGDAPS